MKVRLVEKNMYIILLFAGIQGIRGQDLSEKERRMAEDSTEMVRRKVQQKEVFIQIENLDRHSNFVGHLLIKENNRKVNLGIELLKLGVAKVFGPSAERSPMYNRLMSAQQEAQDAKLGVWENYVEASKDDDVQEKESSGNDRKQTQRTRDAHPMEGKTIKATLTHVENATEFYMAETTSKDYMEVDQYMASVTPVNNRIQEGWDPQAKDRVAGLFDGQYYRCQISSISKKTTPPVYHVVFMDFGNRGRLQESQILPLVRNQNEGRDIADKKPLAIKCRLAGLKPPPAKNEDYCQQAGMFVSNSLYNREIQAKILRVTKSRKQEVHEIVAMVDGDNVNETMVSSGWARIDSKNFDVWGGGRQTKECPFPELLESMKELSASAQGSHVGMYLYGTVDSDDED